MKNFLKNFHTPQKGLEIPGGLRGGGMRRSQNLREHMKLIKVGFPEW